MAISCAAIFARQPSSSELIQRKQHGARCATSCATWMIEAGAHPKDVQGQMRHSRITTTTDIYAQHVPESQRRAVAKMMDMVESRRLRTVTTIN